MGERHVKLTPVQRYIGETMRKTLAANPQARTLVNVDMGPLLKLKEELSAQGDKITVTAFLVKALAVALQKSPDLNSRLVDNEMYVYDNVNVGLAISTAYGLSVPVIKAAEKKSVKEISEEIKELRNKAESRKLNHDDIVGSTVTLTSIGSGRSDIIMPIINNNECMIIGAARTVKTPAVMDDGSIGIKDMMNISVTNNHYLTYGVPIDIFCADLAKIIENPEGYLL